MDVKFETSYLPPDFSKKESTKLNEYLTEDDKGQLIELSEDEFKKKCQG